VVLVESCTTGLRPMADGNGLDDKSTGIADMLA
jgi:hypothetical protein